jgi:hypothetical protein
VGCGQQWVHNRDFLLVHHCHSLREASLFCPFLTFSLSIRSIATSGTVLTFLWCPHNPSITPEYHITSPRSSIQIRPSTTRRTKLTALSSFPCPSPCVMDSHLHRSPPLSPTRSSTTTRESGVRRVAHSPNSLISTLASCPCTRRSQIGGISPYSVRAPSHTPKCANILMPFKVTMTVFGVVAIEVWDTQLPVWAFMLALVIRMSV